MLLDMVENSFGEVRVARIGAHGGPAIAGGLRAAITMSCGRANEGSVQIPSNSSSDLGRSSAAGPAPWNISMSA